MNKIKAPKIKSPTAMHNLRSTIYQLTLICSAIAGTLACNGQLGPSSDEYASYPSYEGSNTDPSRPTPTLTPRNRCIDQDMLSVKEYVKEFINAASDHGREWNNVPSTYDFTGKTGTGTAIFNSQNNYNELLQYHLRIDDNYYTVLHTVTGPFLTITRATYITDSGEFSSLDGMYFNSIRIVTEDAEGNEMENIVCPYPRVYIQKKEEKEGYVIRFHTTDAL